MEIDTGASLTILSEEVFQSFQPAPLLESTTVRLNTYSGESFPILGKCNVTVSYNNSTYTSSVLIVKERGPCLIGRNWLAIIRLYWKTIFRYDPMINCKSY